MSNKIPRLNENENEYLNFSLLFIVSCLRYTAPQILKKFTRLSEQMVYRRLRQYWKDGYIERTSVFGLGRTRIIRLTKKGFQAIGQKSQIQKISEAFLRHDLTAQELMSNFFNNGWEVEVGETRRRLRPDFVAIDEFGVKTGVEIELNIKNSDRYDKIFDKYDKSDCKYVLYLTPNSKVDRLKKVLEGKPCTILTIEEAYKYIRDEY